MTRRTLAGIAFVCLGSVITAAGFGTARHQAPPTPETHSPSDSDQLVIVRIGAALNDAVSRRDKAQLEYGQAVRDIQDLQPQLNQAVAAAKAKLPAAPAGQQWNAQPDGQLGVKFVLGSAPAPGGATTSSGAAASKDNAPNAGKSSAGPAPSQKN
jgi:hypothetical protein